MLIRAPKKSIYQDSKDKTQHITLDEQKTILSTHRATKSWENQIRHKAITNPKSVINKKSSTRLPKGFQAKNGVDKLGQRLPEKDEHVGRSIWRQWLANPWHEVKQNP